MNNTPVENTNPKLFSATAVGIVNKTIGALGGFFILPLMLKQLGTGTFGVWMAISSSVGLIGFLDLGIGNAVVMYLAFNFDNQYNISKFIKIVYRVQGGIVVSSLLVFAVIFRLINWDRILNIDRLSFDVLACIAITIICFIVTLLASTVYAIQRGLRNTLTANCWQLLSTVVYLFCLYGVLENKPTLLLISLVTFGIPLLMAAINTIVFFIRTDVFPKNSAIKIKYEDISTFSVTSGQIFFLQLAALICFETDCLILAHYSNYKAVTEFSIVAKIYAVPVAFFGVYLQALSPTYSAAFSKSQWVWIKKYFYRSLVLGTAGSLVFSIAVLFLNDILLKYWLKNEVHILPPLIITFGCWTILNCIDNNIATMLNGLNKLKVQMVLAVLMVITNVGLSIELVKHLGVTGVIWGTIISTLLFSILPLSIYVLILFRKNR